MVILLKIMKLSSNKIIAITLIVLFTAIFVISFVIYPDIGEKILYGKHPPEEKSNPLEYSQIITSKNYNCMESASIKAQGDLPKFIKEFNDCND